MNGNGQSVPQLSFDSLQQIASSHGIDLNQPLTKENADILNAAFIDNATIPEGTTVKIRWNEETNSGMLDVTCPTVIKYHKPKTEYIGDSTVVDSRTLDNMETPDYFSYGQAGAGHYSRSAYDAAEARKLNIDVNEDWEYSANGEIGTRNAGEYSWVYDPQTGKYIIPNYFVVDQSYSYPLNSGDTIQNNVNSINQQMQDDKWFHVSGNHDNLLSNFGFETEKVDLSDATNNGVSSLYEEGTNYGFVDSEYLDNNTLVTEDVKSHAGVMNNEGVEQFGFLDPKDNVKQLETKIASEIRERLESQYLNYTDTSLDVEYDYKTNKVRIKSDYLPAGGITVDAGQTIGIEGIVSTGINNFATSVNENPNVGSQFKFLININNIDSEYKIDDDTRYEFKRDTNGHVIVDDDGKISVLINNQWCEMTRDQFVNTFGRDSKAVIKNYLNGSKYSYLMDENGDIIYDKDGKVTVYIDNYEIKLTPEELASGEFSLRDNIEDINRVKNELFSMDSDRKDAEISLQKINGEDVYRVVDPYEVRYFKKVNGVYMEVDSDGNQIGPKSENLADLIAKDKQKGANQDGFTDHSYNKNISRNANRAISVTDERKYDSLRGEMKDVGSNLEPISADISGAAGTVEKYAPGSAGKLQKACDNLQKTSNHVDLFGRLVQTVTLMFANCNKDMKDVLDNILFGDSEKSFVDVAFSLKDKITKDNRYTDESFLAAIEKKYGIFVDSLGKPQSAMELISKGNFVFDLTKEEYNKLPPEFKKYLELNENGVYYMSADMVDSIYGNDWSKIFLSGGGDTEKLRELFNNLPNHNGDKIKFGSTDADRQLFEKLVVAPVNDFTYFCTNFEECKNFNNTVNKLKAFQDKELNMIGTIFDPHYQNIYDQIRYTGKYGDKTLGTGDYEFYSLSEMAMNEYYKLNGKQNQFKNLISFDVRKRAALDDACDDVLGKISNGDIDLGDYFQEFCGGFGDGFAKMYKNWAHLFDPSSSSDELKRGYISKIIADEYTLDDVIEMYRNGDLSDKEFETYSKLTGSKTIDGSCKISNFDKQMLLTNYEMGSSMGENFNEMLWSTAESFANYMGVPPAITKLVRNAAKGTATAGEAAHETWEASFDNRANYLYAAGKGIFKFGIGYAKDYLGAKIGGKDWGKSSIDTNVDTIDPSQTKSGWDRLSDAHLKGSFTAPGADSKALDYLKDLDEKSFAEATKKFGLAYGSTGLEQILSNAWYNATVAGGGRDNTYYGTGSDIGGILGQGDSVDAGKTATANKPKDVAGKTFEKLLEITVGGKLKTIGGCTDPTQLLMEFMKFAANDVSKGTNFAVK